MLVCVGLPRGSVLSRPGDMMDGRMIQDDCPSRGLGVAVGTRVAVTLSVKTFM